MLMRRVGGAKKRIKERFICDELAEINDVVFTSASTDGKVIVNTDNKADKPSIGVIVDKLTDDTCIVVLSGVIDYPEPLDRGKKIFIGDDGKLTTTVPTDGYMQVMGLCYKNGKVLLNPEYERTKRKPF